MENLDLGINLGFGETSSVDNLIDKVNILEKSITNINEVSNMDMFTNALKSFQELKSELKDIKSLLNEESQGKDKGNSSQGGKNPYKSETFSLSQTLLNIEKLLTEINSTNKKQGFNNGNYGKSNNGKNNGKNNDNSNDNPLRNRANDELRKYYSNQEKTYKDKKLELDKISKMTTKQFEDGFSKIVKGISKDVVDILDRDLLKKMVEKNATEMLKSSKYINKENLDEKYKEISQLIKNAGFNPNIFKSSSIFRKGYNEKLYETENNRKIQDLKRLEIDLKSKGINRNSNTDTMTGRQLEKLLEDNKRIYNMINSKHFQNFGNGQVFKSTEDKLNKYINQMNDNKIKGQNIKENGLSLQNTIQQNSSTMIAGIEAFRYLGTISNFITSKDFERNMGALGIVGNLGSQASQNASKNRIIRESNSVGADINEFAESVREVIKTGKTYEQSMNLVKTAGKVAVASFEDLTTATNILNQRFTALGISATDKNLNEFANRLQSALDNTALDLQDVNNAGRQTNTAMNALINSAEEKGIQGRSVEKYTMDVSNLELSLLSTLKQQGKTGEQSGIVLRTLFSKLMSVDGRGKVMLENDFKKMTKDEREKVGFGSVEEMTNMVLSGEVDKVIEGLSKMQKQGNLSYATIKKIFTERHASAISTLFTEVNGDTKKFIDNITTGIDVSKNFGKAIENWAVKVERIFKNLKSISTNTFSRGVFGGVLGAGVGIADKLTDLVVKGQSSDNVLLSSFSQGLPQAMTQQFMFKNISDFTQGKAYQKVENAYDLSINRIRSDNSLGKDRKKEMINQVELMKNQDLEKLINNKGINGFASQVKGATANVYDLSNKIKENVSDIDKLKKEGIESFSALSGGAKGLGASLWALSKPIIILTAINMAINTVIGLYEKAQKLKNDADNLDKEIINISKIGSDIETIENNIRDIFDPKNYQSEEENGYIKNVRKMVEANEELKSSIDTINSIKNNPFKDIQTIRDEIWKEKTKNSLINSDNYTTQGRLGISNYKPSGASKNYFTYGNTSRFSIGEWNDEYDRNYRLKYRGEKFNNISVIDKQNEDRISKLSESKRHDELNKYKKMYNNKYVKSTDKAINNLYDDVYAKFKKELKNKGLDEKSVSDEDKQKYLVSNLRISNELVSNVFGKKSAEALNGKDVTDTESFYKLLNSLGGKNLEDNIKIFNDLIASGKIKPETLSLLTQYSNYQLNTIKEADDLFYKQLERNKESLEQSKAMVENLKNKMTSMYEKTGLPSIAYGKILNEEKDDKGNLKTLAQQELDKYNTAYNNDINSVPFEMSLNNMEGVKEYQASMFTYYTKKAGLDKEIQDTQKKLEEAKKQGNLQEQQQLEAKLNWLNQDVKFLDQSKEMAKKVLHFSNFTARKYDELLAMGTELVKAQSVYNNLVGTSFGNQGSQMQTSYDSLNASRSLFNKVGRMNFNNQVNSAYIEDKDGANLQKITGKTDYSQVSMGDYTKVIDKIKYFRENNISEKDGINIETLQNQATVYSSLIAEKIQIQQQEIQLAQQEKQLRIDIVKYWLKENELKANYLENPDRHINNFLISNVDTVRKTQSGDNGLFKMNDLQTITNLKLDNSNMKMGEQLDFARRSIMVAKENAQRQINAIRRLENKNTSNANKSDMLNKSNTISTNNTVATGIDTLSQNLSSMFEELGNVLGSMSMGGFDGSIGGDESSNPNISMNAGNHQRYLANKNYLMEAQKRTGISAGLLGAVAAAESGYNPGANGGGMANVRGIMQIRPKDWNDFYKAGKKYGVSATPSYMNNQQAILAVASRFANNRDSGYFKRLGISNPQAIHYYMTHFLGEGGFSKLYKNYMNVPAAPYMTAEARANHSIFYDSKGRMRTGNEIMAEMNRRMTTAYKSYGVDVALNGSVGKGVSGNYSVSSKGGLDTAMVISGAKGLKVKGKETTGGGKITQSTYDFAKIVQDNIKGFERFTAFNDVYHHKHSPNSGHTKGMKFDFVVSGGTNASNSVVSQLYALAKQYGFDISVINEYTNPSSKATGGHLDVKVNGRGSGSYSSGGTSYRKPNLKMMGTTSEKNAMSGGYVPNISGDLQKEIEKITNYEFEKASIKSEQEEQLIRGLVENVKKWKEENLTLPEIQKNITQYMNDNISIVTDDMTTFKDLTKNIVDKIQTDLEVSKEAYDKMVSQYLEDMNNLHFAFDEMRLKVESTSTDWVRAFNFVNTSEIGDSLLQSFNSMNENTAKINAKLRKMVVDIKINPNLVSMLNYLGENSNTNLRNDREKFEFLTDNNAMLKEFKQLEDRLYDLGKDQFNNLGLDKLTLQNLSAEERNQFLAQVYTEISKQGQTSNDMFLVSQNFNNILTLYRLLGQKIEENIEIKKQETDIMKSFNKVITDFSSKIKSISNSMLNMENNRNLNSAINDFRLYSMNIDPNSKYGKRQAELVKYENNKSVLNEVAQELKTMLSVDKNARKVLEARRYTEEDIDNMDIRDTDKLIELAQEVSKFNTIQNEELRKTLNEFLEDNDLVQYFKDLDITNNTSLSKAKEDLLKNSDIIDKTKLNELLKFFDILENNNIKTEELTKTIIRGINATKDLKESFSESIKHFSDKSVDLLSSILFGTDFEWKGFDYKESLKYLTELGVQNKDSIVKGIDTVLRKLGVDSNLVKEIQPRKLRDKDDFSNDEDDISFNGDIREFYLKNIKYNDVSDNKKPNTLLDDYGNILKINWDNVSKEAVETFKNFLFEGALDDNGYAPYLRNNQLLTTAFDTDGKDGYILYALGDSSKTPLLTSKTQEEMKQKIKEHNIQEWRNQDLDNKDIKSMSMLTYIDNIDDKNRNIEHTDNNQVYRIDILTDEMGEAEKYTQLTIAESEINLRKYSEVWKTLYENNRKNKDKIKKDLSFGVDLYKDLGTKDINLDKGSKDYFPYKVDDRNGIVYLINSAEKVEETGAKVETKEENGKISFYQNGKKVYSLGLENVNKKKNISNIYKYDENGKKELLKKNAKQKDFTDLLSANSKQLEGQTKTGVHFKQTPIYNMYTGRSIENGKLFEYTNYDTYENALEYATKQNHNAINDRRMNDYILNEYSKLSRSNFDKSGTLNRSYEQYNNSLSNPNTQGKISSSFSKVEEKSNKLFGENAIRTAIDINSINTKSFNASDMPSFKGKGLKGNETFFNYITEKTGIPVEWLIAEAYSESGINPLQVDRYYDKKKKKWVESSYKGLYQIGKDYWTPKKAEEISKFFGVDISKDYSKGWSDPKQNALVMLYRMIENVEYQKKQGAKTYSFANGYYSHLLPVYASKMNVLGDDVKVKDFDRKAIKDSYLTNNPRHFIDGINTTNGRAKEGAFNTGVDKLKESGFLTNEYFNNLNNTVQSNDKDKIISQANDVLMVYDSALQQGIITINDKYLSASAEVSDYGDPAVRQYAKDTVGIEEKQNYQERSNTYKGKQFKGYYEGYDDPEYILDIGHFAGESNAYTKDGIGEYEFNREILKKLAKEFEARGIKYGILEREKGAKRIDIDFVNENFKGAKLIELHNNDDNDPNANGIEFLKSNQSKDNDFGFTMLEELNKSTGMKLRGIRGQSPIHDGNGRQFVEGLTNLDNILVELGFLSNQKEVEKMLSNNSHDVVLGLLNGFLKSSGKETVNELLTISKDGAKKETQEEPVKIEIVANNKEENSNLYSDVSKLGKSFNQRMLQAQYDNPINKEQEKTAEEKRKQEQEKKLSTFNTIGHVAIVIDGMLKKELNYKKKQLEIQQKVLELNLQMAETTEERRKIEEQILQNKLSQIDNDYKTQSSFMGGMLSGSMGFGIQGALSGAMQGSSFGLAGSLVGAGLGLVGGILGGTQAKIQADQQKSLQISQQKLTWLAEDRNRYLKTMASAMSEQAKWTTKVGVNDAISRSVKFALSGKDVIGGTAYETRTVGKKKKKGGGLLGSKKYDTVEAFTSSYNLNDSMFGGRQFNNRMDLEFAYTTLAQKLLGMQGTVNSMGTYGDMYYYNSPEQAFFSKFARGGRRQQRTMNLPIDNGLNAYLQRRLSDGSRELTASEFIRYFNGQGTLQGDGLLVDHSRDNEIDNIINNLKETAKAMPTGQQKVDTLALINFYENIKAVLDKEGKTTKRLFGNYYGIETEEVKDEKGNITEYRRVNESMWSDYYNQIYQNVMNGTKVFDTGSKFIQGTLNAFIQNVGSGRNTVKALTDEFNRLADEIYNVVTRTGEFSNVSGSIKGLIDNMALLKKQQRETENFTIDLAKRWVALGGNITDIVKDMNNGLTTAIDSIKSTMLGASLEDTINNFGNNLFQKLGESMTTNLINQKYANSIFKMNSLLSNATDTNSISDIVNLANGYKGLSAKIESDRERLSAIQRLFTANRDIDYVDESIQYETGTSQSVTNNYTFTTDINAGTIVADELSKEILAQNLFAPLVQMLKDSGFIH